MPGKIMFDYTCGCGGEYTSNQPYTLKHSKTINLYVYIQIRNKVQNDMSLWFYHIYCTAYFSFYKKKLQKKYVLSLVIANIFLDTIIKYIFQRNISFYVYISTYFYFYYKQYISWGIYCYLNIQMVSFILIML